MSGWVALVVGVTLGALGSVLAVGTAAVSRLELARWVVQRARGAAMATALLSAPGRVFAVANALATTGLVIAAAGLAAVLWPVPSRVAAAIAAGLVGVPILLVTAYTIPRAIGRRWAEPIVRSAAPALERLARVVAPLVPAGARRPPQGPVLRTEDREAPSTEDLAVVAGLLSFTERPVRDIMTPRTEVVAIEEGTSRRELLTIFAESGYSRLPVYAGSLDHIVGMAYAFDLFKAGDGPLPIRPVTVVPGSRRCADLLVELQRERRQFGVVLDEFGGTAGIVTFEDLLEELVGEIFDEQDVPAGASDQPPALVLDVAGHTPCADVAEAMDVTLDGAETVGGLLAKALGRIPRTGERILLGPLEFDVVAASPVRVDRAIVRRLPVQVTAVTVRSGA
ncbi:MAG: hemolysin family protein [Gemmatimonadales bacterium]